MRKRFIDFKVKYDPDKDTKEDLTKKILYAIFVRRLKAKKPVVIFISGDSGEGKSTAALRLQEVLLEVQGLSLKNYINDVNVYTPLEYPKKLDKLLFDKDLKRVNVICMHEAREIVKSTHWQSFLAQSISDVNALSRAIKRLAIIVISQFIRDITTNIRYTLNYYCKVERPIKKKARLYINVMWKDDNDLEKPRLRKRRLSGYLIYPNGRLRKIVPSYLEVSMPDPEVVEEFEKRDYEAKADIIKSKINKLIKEMEADLQVENNKINSMVEWYANNNDALNMIGKRLKNKWKLKPEVSKMHDLNPSELREFESKLNARFKNLQIKYDGDITYTGEEDGTNEE